jgi:hypothetical protein
VKKKEEIDYRWIVMIMDRHTEIKRERGERGDGVID